MRIRPYGPSLHPLRRTSPAVNEVLRSCFLRAAFQADDQFSGIRSLSTSTVLGTVAHSLLEAAARGEFDKTSRANLDTAVAQKWDALVDSEEQALQERAYGSVPTHTRWPRHALRKATACKVASRIALQRGRASLSISSTAATSASTQTEVWYEGYGGRLVGRIDLLRRSSAGTELIDFKSGLVVEQGEVDGIDLQVKGEYERQVQLYAALIHENEGRWPIKSVVESLVQGPHEVSITSYGVKSAVDEALGLLDAYNREASEGVIRGQPEASTCRWCHFKAICPDFLETAEGSWAGSSNTVIGTLRSVHLEPPSSFRLDITGGDHPRDSIVVRGVPPPLASRLSELEGSKLSLGGLLRTLGSKDLYFDWTSQGWQWHGGNEQ